MTQTDSAKINYQSEPILDSQQFQSFAFVMVRPSHPGNVGACARAIKTMGFSRLILVDPILDDVCKHPNAISMASGAVDVLESCIVVNTLEEALSNIQLAFALTARARIMGPTAVDIRQAAAESVEHLDKNIDTLDSTIQNQENNHNHIKENISNNIAFVLGTESAGLNNHDIALCQRICHIPASPIYSSLNVSQAAQLVAWELRYALVNKLNQPLLPVTYGAPEQGSELASNQDVQAFIKHLEQALIAINFLDPKHPRKLMLRLQHLFNRSNLSVNENKMLRGICSSMINSVNQSKN